MKNFTQIFLAAVMLVVVGMQPAKAQDVNKMTAEQFYAGSPDVRLYHEQLRPESVGGRLRPMASTTTAVPAGPGDYFTGYLAIGGQFYGYGDTVHPRFIAVKSTDEYASRGIYISGRVLIPGPSGQYDSKGQIRYFSPDNYGYFRGGFGGYETISLPAFQLNNDLPSGEYVIDYSIWDATTGKLIQQVFTRFFLNQTGPFGKGPYTVDSVVSTRKIATSGSLVTLQGNFPTDGTVNILAGIIQYTWGQGPYQTDTTGHLVTITTPLVAESGYTGPQQSYDVIVHFPQIRECVSLRSAFAVQIPQNNVSAPISQ